MVILNLLLIKGSSHDSINNPVQTEEKENEQDNTDTSEERNDFEDNDCQISMMPPPDAKRSSTEQFQTGTTCESIALSLLLRVQTNT